MKKYLICLIFFNNHISSQCAENLLSKLSLEEKIAQLFIIGAHNSNSFCESTQDQFIVTNELEKIFLKENIELQIKKYKVGGVHFVQSGTIENSFKYIQYLQSLSEIPLLISQDFEWGLSMRLTDAIKFPRNMTLGAIQNNQLIYELGLEIARQCKLLGVHINFAPVVDINTNYKNPIIGDRSFGEYKENVSQKAICFMKGLQDGGIIACAKHFCGHGDTDVDSHLELPIINHNLTRIYETELYPFKQIINAGVKSIMSAHIHVPTIDSQNKIPITFSKNAITDLLQNKLNFSGLIITDALNMKAITKYFKSSQAAYEAFMAGNDILLMSDNVPESINFIKSKIENNQIDIDLLNKKVLKILKTKEFLNLQKQVILNFDYQQFFLSEAKKLKKDLYASAVTLIKNEDKLIASPVLINKKICSISIGKPKLKDFFNNELSNFCELDKYCVNKTNSEKLQKLLNLIDKYEVIIIGLSDLTKQTSQNYGITNETLDFLNTLNEKNKKVILAIFGSPYSLKFFKNFKNIIMAYEDEQDAYIATAQIIFGKYIPLGQLPISIN